MRKKLNIVNIEKLIDQDVSKFYKVVKMTKGLTTYYIFVLELATGNIYELKLNRESINLGEPYYWELKYGNESTRLSKFELRSMDAVKHSIGLLLDPLPF